VDTTPHTPRRLVTRTRACAAAGLIVLAGGVGRLALAQQPAPRTEPAARLGKPRPSDEPPPRVLSRGATPDAESSVSVYPSAMASSPQPPTSPGWMSGPGYSTNRPVFGSASQPQYQSAVRPGRVPQQSYIVEESRPGPIANAWSGVKEFVTGRPAGPAPVVRTTPTYAELPGARTVTAPLSRTVATGMYAGPPAYRWYGWGTTTPGSNPYAPTGQYPRGSANWYTQTGATPGAFPVPVTASGTRPEPGMEPPAYVRGATPEPDVTPLPRLIVADMPPELNYICNPVPGPAFAAPPAGPVFTVPVPPGAPPVVRADTPPVIAQTPPPSATVPASVVVPPEPVEAPADGGPAWQRSGGEPIPFGTPLVRSQEPRPRDPSPEAAVRAACKGLAAVSEVRQSGPNQLVVKVTAATPGDARAAFAAVSAVPELKPYKVEFEANVGGR
jgi:hypothetical protein